jgi:uncharacterized protein
MDFGYNFQGIDFEWNDEKAAANLRNHNISFEFACEAFFDPFLRVEDAGVVEGEQREAVIGLTADWKLLSDVYVVRGEVIRIVSARAATAAERKIYEDSRA